MFDNLDHLDNLEEFQYHLNQNLKVDSLPSFVSAVGLSPSMDDHILEEKGLVQVEPHRIAGILAEFRQAAEEHKLNVEKLRDAYYEWKYECEKDGTTTFYEAESAEAESAEADSPGNLNFSL